MSMCPVCNAFDQLEKDCIKCSATLDDKGKITDFLDPYGHYNDIETVKSADGFPFTVSAQQCPHLLYCHYCHHEEIEFVQEE